MNCLRMYVIAMSACGVMLLGAAAEANDIYNNLPNVTTSGGTDPVAVDGPASDSFSTGSGVSILTDIKMMLSGFSGAPVGAQFTVSLLSDSSSNPGSLLVTLGTFSDSTLATTASVYDISVANYVLAANTRYWVELNIAPASPSSNVAWDYATDAKGVGVSGEYWAYYPLGVLTVTANSDTNGPFQMEVTTSDSSPVPEPGTLCQTLSAIGIGIIASARRRMACAL